MKILRSVEATGEMSALVANPPRYDYPQLEYHDCVEETTASKATCASATAG